MISACERDYSLCVQEPRNEAKPPAQVVVAFAYYFLSCSIWLFFTCMHRVPCAFLAIPFDLEISITWVW